MMAATFEYSRHGVMGSFAYDSSDEAILEALTFLEHDQCFPVRISENGQQVWAFEDWKDGSMTASVDDLRRIATERGIPLPE